MLYKQSNHAGSFLTPEDKRCKAPGRTTPGLTGNQILCATIPLVLKHPHAVTVSITGPISGFGRKISGWGSILLLIVPMPFVLKTDDNT
ncbi:hypothetical protein DPEC_G00373760, partial [Dallia pectoralis]